jgi:trigger factor
MKTIPLETDAETIDKDRVRLRVAVPEAALDPALRAVYKRWAQQMKVPGFRKGKVPRQLIDARVGSDVVRDEALRDALPGFYEEALKSKDLEAIAPPEVEVIEFEAGSALVFEATVDVRPEIELPDLTAVSVEAPNANVTDQDIDEQIDRLRDRFAELESIGREARRGDFVLIDLNAYRHEQPLEEASAPDYLYEVGSRAGPPRLDEELEGSRPGAILKFNDVLGENAGELAGEEVSFTVLVKEVKAKSLPSVDDEFAKTVGEFDTLAELRDDFRMRLKDVKRGLAEEELRGMVLEALVDAAKFDPPVKLVEGEFEHRLEHLEEDLKKAGLSMGQYAREMDSSELEIRADVRRSAARSVKAELLLEEIARTERIEVTEEDLGREVAIAAARAQRDPQELAKQLVDAGRLGAVAADIMRRKALDHVVNNVNTIGWEAVEESSTLVTSEVSSGGDHEAVAERAQE